MGITEESVLQEILEQSLAGFWDWDIPSGNEYLSPSFKKMFGYEDHEIENRAESWQKLIFTEDLPGVLENFKQHVESKGAVPYYSEVRYRHKNGSTVWVICTGKVIEWDADGKPLRMVGCHVDITRRKQVEEAMQQNEAKLRTFVANQPGVAFIIDKNGIFTLSEGLGLAKLGLKPGQVVGSSVFDVYKDVPEIGKHIRQALSGSIRQFQVSVGKADFDVWLGPLINADGVVEGVIGISSDITERKHTEQALANIQKLESLGILAGGIAHDFNNLMGGIFGFVDLARESSQQPEVKQLLGKVMQTIERARALTGQLLTFSKGGAPKLEVAPLFPFVQQNTQFALSGSNVSCTFTVADDLWSANFDKNQIGQVIDNLIINAQQAMPLGGVISVSADNVTLAEYDHPVLKSGEYVRLVVTDTGVGIPSDLQKRIFDPFFTTKTRGHGLGLATCHSIIRRHGGSIDVYSEPAKGSTFTVYLPAAREETRMSAADKAVIHRGSGAFLVMDDETIMLAVLTDMLKTFGYSVVGTASGQEAIAYIEAALGSNNLPVAMLFDLTVPGAMGGKDAIAQIRDMGVDIPAFVASGYADDPIMKNPADYGFMASISKPFKQSELAAMLEKAMPKNIL